MAVVYLGLGSNMGDRAANFERALELLKAAGLDVRQMSSTLETDPVGGPPQEKFLNAAVEAHTSLLPADLLKAVKQVEAEMGRVKTVANGPRPIDIDILLYDTITLQSQDLTIPHPRMHQRSFVMDPLKEIAPERVKEFFDARH